MNKHDSYWKGRMAWALLLLVPTLSFGQNAYEGIYIGAYQGAHDDGEFALIVNSQGQGILAAYDISDDTGYVEKNISIRTDGSFRFVTQRGAHIEGRATAKGISGNYHAMGTDGRFNGQRMPPDGPFENAAGYYSGRASLTAPKAGVTVNGRMEAIIAADGSAFFLFERSLPRFGSAAAPRVEFDLDFGLGFGPGFDLDYEFGLGFGGPGNCAFFGPGMGYSVKISLLGFVDLDFDFHRPTCSSPWVWGMRPGLWGHPAASLEYSGGIVSIAPDGEIHELLGDGLLLQGNLDTGGWGAKGVLTSYEGATAWSGRWSVERQHDTTSYFAALSYGGLPDVDGDGHADILWHHALTNKNAAWLMNGSDVVVEFVFAAPEEIIKTSRWSLAHAWELNGNRRADLVWRHDESGDILVAFDDGTTSPRFKLGPLWKAIGSGDFDGDALPEMLVTNAASGASALTMDLASDPKLVPLPSPENPEWLPVAVADFDANRSADVLWMDRQSGDLLLWLMDGMEVVEEIDPKEGLPKRLTLAGVGDLDGDGSADIIWRDLAAGTVRAAMHLGEGANESILLASNVSSEWQLAAFGDLDGDGIDDAVWRHRQTGENRIWRIVDSQPGDSGPLPPVRDLHWMIQH